MYDKKDVVVSADGVPIHYQVCGEGTPALVLVHGWCCDRSYWERQVGQFAHQYKVVTVDLAGHGESGLGRKAWTMAAFGEDVVAVVKKVGLEQVVLIGHSMGGHVIVEATRRMPERVVGLVGVDAFKKLDLTRTQKQIDDFLVPFRANFAETIRNVVRKVMFVPTSDTALVEKIVADMSGAPPEVGIGTLQELFSHGSRLRETLQEVKMPIITINSDFEPTNVEAAGRYGIEIAFMSGVGHFVMMEDPETFSHLLDEAVKKLVRSRGGNDD
jgi:pimeloyl-ACP methyl ester carboxylesterase